jgi:GT2 family glycosyltransferase
LFSLIIPFHSDLGRLSETLEILKLEAKRQEIGEILLCHNGSVLEASTRAAVEARTWEGVRLLTTEAKGIGAGYKLGIRDASEEYLVLSASDLPFRFTDIDAFRDYRREHGSFPEVAIGSKAHPQSRLSGSYGLSRRVASRGFWILRALFLGRATPKDSQGTIIIRNALAKSLLPELVFDSYTASLELVTRAQRRGCSVIELPIEFEAHEASDSSVSLVADSIQMARELRTLARGLKQRSD